MEKKKNTKKTEDTQNELKDELRIEGINCKGYGMLPKSVMLDTTLPIESRTIYAYFCSYSGAGTSAFPGRAKILSDLCLAKDTYYKYYNVLKDEGYITVQQKNSGGKGFGYLRNIYTLAAVPNKYKSPLPTDKTDTQERICFEGLASGGFGFIPKAIMTDRRLKLRAKAIYAYFACFAGAGNAVFPKVDNILYHVGFSVATYYRILKSLRDTNYITVVQRKVGGRFDVNDIYLNVNPDDTIVPQKSVKSIPIITPEETAESENTQRNKVQFTPPIQNQDTLTGASEELPTLQNQDTLTSIPSKHISPPQNQDTRNKDIKSNSININSIYNNQSIYLSDEGMDENSFVEVLDKDAIETQIKTNVDYYRFADNDTSALKRIYTQCIALMVDTCCTAEPYVRIGTVNIPSTAVRKRFCSLTGEELDATLEHIKEQADKVKNWTSYLLTSIYTAPVLSDIGTDFAIYRDFESLKNDQNKSYSL